MIEIVILYVLTKYDANIYRITKIVDEYFFGFLKGSTGTINPALKRLEKIGAVEFKDKMSEGGMLSKIYSITPEGKKHLSNLLLTFQSQNPYHILNEAKILLYCSEVLSVSQMIEFKENILNILELYKIKLERGLKDEYINLNPIQKRTIEITLEETKSLIGAL